MSDVCSPDQVLTKAAHRELVFEGIGSDEENLSLIIRDDKNPNETDKVYKIPLYQARAQQTGANVADIELVCTYPMIYDTKDESDDYISNLSAGYVYVYVDGYLWRELQVIVEECGVVKFRDVNLAYQKGFLPWKKNKNKAYAKQGRRDATGQALSSIIVPNKIKGAQCSVEMAFSEVQWSWSQILKLGGMNPSDPRLNYGDPLSSEERDCPDRSVSTIARNKRMQKLDNLSDFENGFTQTGIIKNGAKIHRKIPHIAADKFAKVILNNGLSVVRNYVDAILKLQVEIASTLYEVKGVELGPDGQEVIKDPIKKANFELAEKMINRFYQMNDAILDGDITIKGDKDAQRLQAEQLKFANKIKNWRSSCLNETNLKTFLKYDRLLALADEIKSQQLVLIEILEQDINTVKFVHCMEDFAYHYNAHYASGFDVIKDIALVLKIHPASQFPTIILDKGDWDNLTTSTTTSSIMLKLVGEHPSEPAHPISKLFFGKPKKPATATKPAGIELDPQDHSDKFNPKFSIERIQMVAEDNSFNEIDKEAVEQIGRRLAQALMGMATGYLDLSLIASANQGQAQTAAAFNKQVQSEKSAGIAQQEQLKKQAELQTVQKQKLEAKLSQTEQTLADKVKGLEKTDAEYRRQHALAKPEIDKLKAELGAVDSKLNKAQKSLRNINNKLAHIELELAQTGSAKLSKNKGLMAALRIINQLENGQFTVLEMTAQDYHNGKFSKGFIPLNARARAEIAQELSKEIRDLVRAQNRSRTNITTARGPINATVDDVMHLRNKLTHLLDIADKAQGVLAGEGASQLKLDVIALKETVDAKQLNVTSLKDEIAQLKNNQLKLADDVRTNQHLNQKLAELATATEHLANQKFLSNASVNTLSKANIGILGAVGLFEVLNLTRSLEQFELTAKSAKVFAGGALDFTAVVLTLVRESYLMKYGMPTEQQLLLLLEGDVNVPKGIQRVFKFSKYMYRANIAASIYSGVTSFIDGFDAIKRGDNDAAFGLLTMGVGFTLMTVGDAIALRGLLLGIKVGSRLGWIGLIIVLVGAVIYYLFVDDEIEAWLKISPWGTDAYGDDNSSSWRTRPDYALHDFAQLTTAPQVHSDNVEKLHDMYTIAQSRGAVTTYEDPTEAYLILTCPTNTAFNFIDVELAVKPREGLLDFFGNDDEYQNLVLGDSAGQGQNWRQTFWDNVLVTDLSSGQGVRLDLNQYNCTAIFKALNTTRITFRLRVKTYPKGKGASVSDAFKDNNFILPVSKRDEDGELEEPDKWLTTEVNLSLLNYALKEELGLE
ncbi:hypothetical protein [Pseudoalteromonas prydzensis]|uniref:hypothetical protein n=1 Tax=Pseudoalteromonas prydzensis TaxID=182141 RepID=UPI0024BC781E|nr:hypothetical protein [Pseudoalteromonas prydzensis]